MSSKRISEGFLGEDPKQTFWHGHSFTANPLGCAAANASLDLLENSPEKYLHFESRHLPHLQKIVKDPRIECPRITGTIAAFNIKVKGKKGYLNSVGKILKATALKVGVFIRPFSLFEDNTNLKKALLGNVGLQLFSAPVSYTHLTQPTIYSV